MARYINEDEFVAWVKEHWCADCQNDNGLRCRACWIDDAIDIVEEAPEADVVPKSEYEMLQGALKAEERHNELTMKMAQKALKNARSELASEIFAEIEKHLIFNAYGIATISDKTFAELKKKYTEGKQ